MSWQTRLDIPHIGQLPAGSRNAISDVAGVTVGHLTLAKNEIQTGITVVRPHPGDLFRDKLPAACAVLNGFGKSTGLIQLQELGTLETPIALCNTFAVGTVATAQIVAAIQDNPEIGRHLSTVNPLVLECNDGYLNDIQQQSIHGVDYLHALNDTRADFSQGAVGAGRGMSCFEIKGGIGSASRLIRIGAKTYHVGALVLANFGKLGALTIAGHPLGLRLKEHLVHSPLTPEAGSIIMLLATDAPLDARQLKRLALRAGAGLARSGSVFGHGSGDIALAFSTAQKIPHQPTRTVLSLQQLHESLLDTLFQASADSCEQAILHALFAAETVKGYAGHNRTALAELLAKHNISL